MYMIGRKLTMSRLESFFNKGFFKVFRFKKEDLRKALQWFNRHGSKAVLICRLIPLMRSIISIPAGMAKMKITIFLCFTVIGTFIWNTVLVFLGRLAGNAWEKIVLYLDYYSLTTDALIFLILGFVLLKKKLKI